MPRCIAQSTERRQTSTATPQRLSQEALSSPGLWPTRCCTYSDAGVGLRPSREGGAQSMEGREPRALGPNSIRATLCLRLRRQARQSSGGRRVLSLVSPRLHVFACSSAPFCPPLLPARLLPLLLLLLLLLFYYRLPPSSSALGSLSQRWPPIPSRGSTASLASPLASALPAPYLLVPGLGSALARTSHFACLALHQASRTLPFIIIAFATIPTSRASLSSLFRASALAQSRPLQRNKT